MEPTNTPANLPVNPSQPEPSISHSTPQQPKTSNYLLIGLVILVILLLASTGYLAYQNYQLQDQLKNSQNLVSQTATPTPTPSNKQENTSSNNCGVMFPSLSQEQEIDKDGRSWQIEEAKQQLFMFTDYIRAIHRSSSEASGYMSGVVEVYCTPNTEKLTTSDFNYQLDTYLIEKAEGENAIVMNSTKETKMWGLNVREVTIKGGMFDETKKYYLFTTQKYKYLISKVSMSTDTSVQQATESIFKGLKFEN